MLLHHQIGALMAKETSKSFTYQTRLPPKLHQDTVLSAYAETMSHVKRRLFADISAGKKIKDLKSPYLTQHEITARQFNSCRIDLEGIIASRKAWLAGEIADSTGRIESLEKTIQQAEKQQKHPHFIHQKKRRLTTLTHTLNKKKADLETGKIRICFGTKKLFHAQFALEENGYSSHEEWYEDFH